MKLADLDELKDSIDVCMEIEFRFNKQHYFIGYREDNSLVDAFILKSPDIEIGHTLGGNKFNILDIPVIDGKKISDIWNELEMELY